MLQGNIISNQTGGEIKLVRDGIPSILKNVADGVDATDAATKGQLDASIGLNNELSEVLANGNATSGNNLTITAGDGIVSSVGTFRMGFFPTAATEVIAEGAGGAISVATHLTTIGADVGGDAFTLAVGTVIGQMKKIAFVSTSGGTGVVTAAFRGAGTTLTFTAAGEYALLMWDGTDWLDLELSSVGAGLATPPAIT